jgi:hypothetical protein
MKSTPLTQGISMVVLVIYVLYSFFVLPFAGFLLSLAFGLISYGSLESFEMSVSIIIITGVIYSLIAKSSEKEATARLTTTRPRIEAFKDLTTISKRVQSIEKKQPSGVYASGFVEGFADADENSDTPTAAAAASQPGSASGEGGVGSGIEPPKPPTINMSGPVDEEKRKKQDEDNEVSGFTDLNNSKKGEFKLGVLPDEEKGGHHIDQGTTVMNALNALKPDQIKAMSSDTQKLIDTQKSLMSMLSTMKPMLQDGQQMMNNFQEMFGKSGGQFKMA